MQQQYEAPLPAGQFQEAPPKEALITLNQLIANTEDKQEREVLFQERSFANLQRRAKFYSQSTVVPDIYKNNMPNCMIAIDMADRLGVGEIEIMQNLYIVYGRPGFSSQYIIARINASGILQGRLKFRFIGEKGTESYGCVAYGVDSKTGEALEGVEVTLKMAVDEGWWGKNGSKWPTMTDQMLIYRAACFFSRAYAGDAILGMTSTEELYDVGQNNEAVISSTFENQSSGIADQIKQKIDEKQESQTDDHVKESGEKKQNQTTEAPAPEVEEQQQRNDQPQKADSKSKRPAAKKAEEQPKSNEAADDSDMFGG